MATFTSARLAGPTQPGTSFSLLYTVPAATTVIVKEIVITNVTAGAVTAGVGINSTQIQNLLVSSKSIPANDIVVLALSTVLNAGDLLYGISGITAGITMTVSGVTIV